MSGIQKLHCTATSVYLPCQTARVKYANIFFLLYCLYHPVGLVLFVLCASHTFLISDFVFYVLATPDAVSSSEDPLVGDQGATTSMVEAAATLVLQRHLRRTNNDSTQSFSYNFRNWPEDTERTSLKGAIPARASCSHGHPLHQPPW